MVVVELASGVVLGIGLFFLVVPRPQRTVSILRNWVDEVGFAGVPIPVVVVTLGLVGLALGGVTALVVPIVSLAPIAGVAGSTFPVIVALAARDARRERARALWPDIVDGIRVAIRSGSSLTDAIESATPLVPRDWHKAWTAVSTDLRRGADVSTALGRLRESLADPVADRVIESVLVARELGGRELPTVLAELARGVRSEHALRREIRSRQSWVRNAARLGVAAPWIVLVLLASRPESRDAYSSPAGAVVLVVAAGATAVAYWVMSALGSLREPPRWLLGRP